MHSNRPLQPARDHSPSGGLSITDADARPASASEGVAILACPGPRFTRRVAERFGRTAVIACREAPHVVLDLGGVTVIDAAGLRAVSALARGCRAAGGELRLCRPAPAVRLLLAAAGLHDHAEVYQARETAVLAARSS